MCKYPKFMCTSQFATDLRAGQRAPCRNLLATIGELARLERRPAASDYCALMPSPHINCCHDAEDCGKTGGMSAMLENIRVNLPSPEKYRIMYWSCSGSRRAISSVHLSTK